MRVSLQAGVESKTHACAWQATHRLYDSPRYRCRGRSRERSAVGGGLASANTLTLQQTVAYALTHNPSIAAKQAALAQAESTYTRQRATELPPVVASLQNVLEKQNNYGGTLAQYGVAPIPKFSLNTAQIGTQWTLYNGSLNQISRSRTIVKSKLRAPICGRRRRRPLPEVVAMFFAIANSQHLSI